MGKIIDENTALNTLGKNFTMFETLYLLFSNPGKKLPFANNTSIQFGTKNKKPTKEEAYFEAALATVAQEFGKVTFTPEATTALWNYSHYYPTMKSLADKNVGIVMNGEKDEHGLPVFVGVKDKLLETQQEFVKCYGENWQEIILGQK